MNYHWKWALAALALGFILAGCAAGDVPATAGTPPVEGGDQTAPGSPLLDEDALATPTPDVTEEGPTPQPPATRLPPRVPLTPVPNVRGEAPGDLVDQAIADLAGRLGAPEAEIEVVSDAAVIWNDGSLGCPQPGAFYTQALVEGYQIILRYRDQTYDYHADANRVFLCRPASLGVPRRSEPNAELRLVQLATADLAARLGIAAADIQPDSIHPQTWPDSSLGCPEPGMAYAQVETPGYEISLRSGGEIYTYHSDLERVVYCEP